MKVRLYLLLALALVFSSARAEWFDPAKRDSISSGGGDFSFIVMADSQGWPEAEDSTVSPPDFRSMVILANKYEPDFVTIAGDLVRGYTNLETLVRELDGFHETCALMKSPYVTVVGNHDVWDEISRDAWLERHGPLYFSWDHKGCHFIALNSETIGNRLNIEGEQLEWLARDLEKAREARRIFVFLHNPAWTNETTREGVESSQWLRDVHPLLAKYGVDTVFAGHFHSYICFPKRDGVRYVILGPTGGPIGEFPSFFNFLVVDVRDRTSSHKVVTFEGELPEGFITRAAEREFAAAYREEFLPPNSRGQSAVRISLKNTLPYDMKLRLALDPMDSSWKKAKERATLKPGEERAILLKTMIKGSIFPPPAIEIGMSIRGIEFQQTRERVYIPLDLSTDPRLMDDFEDGDFTNLCEINGIVRGEAGRWWSSKDPHGLSNVADFAVEEISDGVAGSTRAGHVTGHLGKSSPGKRAEAFFFMGLASDWREVDLSAASGMSFLAKSSTESDISVHLLDWGKDEEAFKTMISLGPEWERYVILWKGSPLASRVMMPSFKIQDEGEEFDVWIDDLALVFTE